MGENLVEPIYNEVGQASNYFINRIRLTNYNPLVVKKIEAEN
jgi:hypothetical protein